MIPLLRFVRSTRQWYVWIASDKKRLYFGTDPTVARQRYAAWLAGHGETVTEFRHSFATVSEVIEIYRKHAATRYAHDRAATHLLATALSMVVELYGNQPASTFKAKALRDVRQRLLTAGKRPRSRKYANALGKAVQKAWRWLGAEELVVKPVAAPRVSLDELLSAITDDNLHGEVDTSPPVGAEAW